MSDVNSDDRADVIFTALLSGLNSQVWQYRVPAREQEQLTRPAVISGEVFFCACLCPPTISHYASKKRSAQVA
jgi:hypothetical protein